MPDLNWDRVSVPATAVDAQPSAWDRVSVPVPDIVPGGNGQPARITVRPPSAQENDPGAFGAAALGAVQGLTANFGDELTGAMAAAGAGGEPAAVEREPGGVDALVGLARLGYESLTGRGKASDAYEKARDRFRETFQRAREAHPVATGAGEFGGAMALPVGGAMAGVSLGARALRGALTGGAMGGMAGIGAGTDVGDRAVQGATGAGLGSAIGAVGVPVAEYGSRAAMAAARPIISRFDSVFRPSNEAARRVAAARRADEAIDPTASSRLTPQEFSAAQSTGTPVKTMDAGGENTRALARSAANLSPDARARLDQTITPRFEQQSTRLSEWLNSALHYPDQSRQRVIRKVAETIYEPRYAKAWKESANVKLWDETLSELAQAPEVQNAIRVATANFRNWAVRDGMKPPLQAFRIADGRTTLMESKSGSSDRLPSLQYWDYVKRALDQSGNPPAQQLARALREHLDTLVPAYKAARASAQPTKFFGGAPNAFEAGHSFLDRGQRYGPEARAQLARMTPEERNLFHDGYLTAMAEKIAQRPDRLDAISRINASPAARQETEAALGTQRFRELEATLRVERLMDLARGAVKGNSTTVRQYIEYGLAGAGAGMGAFNLDPTTMGASAMVVGRRAVNARMARKVAELLTSDNTDAVRHGISLLARDDRMMTSLRKLGNAAASRGLPQQTTNALGPQAVSAARPEDQQVPGPHQ